MMKMKMTTRLRWIQMVALALSALLLATACDDDSSTTPISENDTGGFRDITEADITESDTGKPDATVITETDRLVLIDPPDGVMKIAHSSEAILKVKFETDKGIPIPDQAIDVEIVSTAPDANCHQAELPCIQVFTVQGVTLEDGVADFSFKARTKDTDVVVRFSVAGIDTVDAVDATIQIRAKDSYDLIVDFEYEGDRAFNKITPLLFDPVPSSTVPRPATTCDEVYLVDNPRSTADFFPTVARSAPDVTRNPDGSIQPAVYTSLKTGNVYIAAGYAKTSSGQTVRVYGCTETLEPSPEGSNPRMKVTLVEVPYIVTGDYALTSNFDILSILPSRTDPADPREAGDWVRLVVDFFGDPAGAVVELLLEIDIIEQNLPSFAQSIAREFLRSAFDSFAPQWLRDIVTVGADIGDLVENLELSGTLKVVSEPTACDPSAPDADITCLSGENIHEYNSITFRWSLAALPEVMQNACVVSPSKGSPYYTCPLNTLLGRDGAYIIRGNWTGGFDADNLSIDNHPVLVPYGEILLGLIENLLLPTVFNDQSVNSIGAMIERLLGDVIIGYYNDQRDPADPAVTETGCIGVGQALGAWTGVGFAADVTRVLCEQGVSFVQGYVQDFATGLVLDAGSGFTFETKAGSPCRAFDSDDDLVYDQLGGTANPATDRCYWTISFTGGNAIDGRFDATRK
jgi:hypothetical protein